MAISAADLVHLRNQAPFTAVVKWYLAIAPYGDSHLFTARVNDAGIAQGEREIVYDGDAGEDDVVAGMTLWVGNSAGAYDVGMIRIRSINTVTNTITVAENDHILWEDDLYLTVPGEAGFYEIWGRYQRLIEEDLGEGDYEVLKDYDVVWDTGDYTENLCPKANAGPPVCKFIDEDLGYVDVDFIGEDSYATKVGAAITAWLWDFADGVVQPGDAANQEGTTADPNTVRFSTPGFRYVSLTVTDSNGRTGVVYVPVWIFDEDEPPYKQVEVRNLSNDGGGWQAELEVFSTNTAAEDIINEFPDGALCVLFTETTYGGTTTSVYGYHDREEIEFVGWLRGETLDFDFEAGSVTFEAVSTDGILEQTPGFAFSLEDSDDPSDWDHFLDLNVDRAMHFLFQWHTTVNWVCHVERVGEGVARPIAIQSFPRANVLEQVNDHLLNDAQCNLMTDRQGIARATQNPQYMQLAARAGVDVACALTDADILNRLEFRRQYGQRMGYVELGGFSYETPYLSRAPGRAPSRSNEEVHEEGFIVTGQAELNQWTGLRYSLENLDYPETPIDLVGFWPAFDPALQNYIRLTITDPLGRVSWTDERFIVRGVRHAAYPRDMTVLTELTVEHENDILTGETIDMPEPDEWEPVNYEPWNPPSIPINDIPIWPEGVGMALGWDDTNVGWTAGLLPDTGADWLGAGPHWIDVTGTLSGETIIWVLYVQTGADTVGAWALTDQGAYWCDDVLTSSITWTSKLTLAAMRTLTGYGGATFRGMHAYCADPTFLIITIDPGVGNKNCGYWWNSAVYTNDTGGNWNVSSCRNVNRVPYMALDVDENNGDIYMMGACGIMVTDYILCKSTDGGATFPQIENLSGACTLYQAGWNFMVTPLMASGTLYGTCRSGTWVFDGVSETSITPGGKTTDKDWGGIECWTFDANKVWAVFDSNELWASTDGGSNWNQLVGLLGAGNLCKPGGWPGNENVIWVVRHDTGGGGIFMQYSPDDGANWYDLTGDWETEIANWQGGEQGSLLPLPRVGANSE